MASEFEKPFRFEVDPDDASQPGAPGDRAQRDKQDLLEVISDRLPRGRITLVQKRDPLDVFRDELWRSMVERRGE